MIHIKNVVWCMAYSYIKMIALLSMRLNLKPPTILYYLPQTKLFLIPLKILLCVSQMMLPMNDSFPSQSCEQSISRKYVSVNKASQSTVIHHFVNFYYASGWGNLITRVRESPLITPDGNACQPHCRNTSI